MADLAALEYAALRATIAARGTWRVGVAVATVAAWAATLVAVLSLLPYPAAALIPLSVLVAGAEAVRVLHLGVERIGRYLQVLYEPIGGVPAWERTAMQLGPAMPGAGGHPLFLPVFGVALVVNLLALWTPGPTSAELAVVGGSHLLAVVWGVRADLAMRRQRASDLAAFERLQRGA